MPIVRPSSENSVSVPYEWESIDDVFVPVIFREEKKYLAVRIAELKLLTKFPSTLPDELKSLEKCSSGFLTAQETLVLDKINRDICKGEYGREPFTANDVVVAFDEFRKFYELVNDTVLCKNALDLGLTDGGWVQINNTVSPYVCKDSVKYLPVEIVCIAAEVLSDDRITTVAATQSQLAILNALCKKSNSCFSFDDNTNLVSMLILKKEFNVVVMEIPPNDPFTHGTYLDPFLDDDSIYQHKVKAKRAMNAFYNEAIVRKYNQVAADKLLALADNVYPSMEEAVGNDYLTSAQYSPDFSADDCQTPAPVESPSSAASQQTQDDDNSSVDVTEDMADTTDKTSQQDEEKDEKTQKEEQSDKINVLKTYGRSDNKTKTNNKSSSSFTAIESELLTSQLRTIDINLVKAVAHMGSMKAFSKLLKIGSVIDMRIVRFLCRSIAIFHKVRKILSLALEILQRDSDRHDKSSCCAQAIVVVKDAITKYEFWTAANHKISIGVAGLVNTTLLQAVFEDSAFSFTRKPDVSHFLIAGMFGARTSSAAANFRFLQMIYSAGCVASSGCSVDPFTAYISVSRNYANSSSTLCKWWHKVPTTPHNITKEMFIANLYKFYDEVYYAPGQQRSQVQQLNVETPANARTLTSANTQHSLWIPVTVMLTSASSLNHLPLPVANLCLPQTPLQQHTHPAYSHLYSHGYTTPRMSAVVQAPTVAHMQTVQRHRTAISVMERLPTPPPFLSQQQSTIQTPTTSGWTQGPVPMLSEKDKQRTGYKHLRAAPYRTPVTHQQHVSLDYTAKSSTPLSIACPELITVSPAAPTHLPCHAQQSVSETQSSRSGVVASSEPVEDLSDHINLIRAHGKKITIFEKGVCRWALAEDVQKIYFPRMNMDEFLREMVRNGVLLDLSPQVGQAFRRHYDMSDSEEFEVEKMLTVDSLSVVIPSLK